MAKRILITGGAGFIGSHLADELLEHGHQVRILDRLSAQVHANGKERPIYLSRDAAFGALRECRSLRALHAFDSSSSTARLHPPGDPNAYGDFIDVLITGFEWIELWNEPGSIGRMGSHLGPALGKVLRDARGAAYGRSAAVNAPCSPASMYSTPTGWNSCFGAA